MTLLSNSFTQTAQPVATPVPPMTPLPPLTIAAFPQSENGERAMQSASSSRFMGRAKMTVHPGGLAAAMQLCGSGTVAELLVIETDEAEPALLAGLEALAELCDAETRVVVIGTSNDIGLYRALLRQGVSDYLPLPVTSEQILRSLFDITAQPGAVAKGAVTVFLGSGGGVGSSTVALNTAWLTGQQRHACTNLIDLDLDFGTAGLSLALDGGHGIAGALAAGTNLDGQMLDGLFDSYDAHLKVLTAGDNPALVPDPKPETLDHLTDLARSGGQRVMLDLPGFGSAVTRRAVRTADHVVLTTSPDLPGLKNTRKLLDLITALRLGEAKPLVVLNRVGMVRRLEIAPRDFAQTLGIDLAATVAFDPKGFVHATNSGKVLAATAAGKSVQTALKPLVAALTTQPAAQPTAKPAALPLLSRLFHRG